MKTIIQSNRFLWGIILFSSLIFSPSLGNFFFGDDWFHLRISYIGNFGEFMNFFSFIQTPQSATFYRPVSTQIFNFIFQSLFGLNPWPYHAFILSLFISSLIIFHRVATQILNNQKQALLALLFYGISATHFTKFYYLAASQEIIMLFFGLLMIMFYLKKTSFINRILSIVFFTFAILSRETAVTLPVVLLLIDWGGGKVNLKKIIPYILILVPYLILRLFIFGGISGDSYIWDFSIKRAFNTLGWYTLWSLGSPELLVDYVSGGLKIIPRFYTDFPKFSYVILSLTMLIVISFLLLVIKNIKHINRKIISLMGIFLIGIFPVIFLPWHKFSLELTIAMLGFSMALAALVTKERLKILSMGVVVIFIILNLWTNFLTYQTNYAVKRAKVSEQVFNYFSLNYPTPLQGKYFEFINDTSYFGEAWGSSKQVAAATSRSDLFKVLYKDSNVQVYFEDIVEVRPKDEKKIPISSAMFLK